MASCSPSPASSRLRIKENLLADAELELHVAAPAGTRATVVIDLGILEL